MSFRNKFFTLVLSILFVLVSGSCQVFALTINVTGNSHEITDGESSGLGMSVKGGENFSITLTASDLSGASVQWNNTWSDYDKDTYEKMQLPNYKYTTDGTESKQLSTVNFSPSGNMLTIAGTLNSDVARLTLIIVATELDSNGNAITISYPVIPSTATWGFTIDNSDYFGNNNAPAPSPEQENGENNNNKVPDQNLNKNESKELEHAVITPVKLSDDVIERLAENISVDVNEFKLLTSRDFTTTIPPEPTDKMRQQVKDKGYEFAAKLNTINVQKDGWYVFQVTVSDDLLGTKVSDLKLYGAERGDFISANSSGTVRAAFGLMPLVNGITGGFEVSNLLGVKLDTLPKQFLATMFLSASKSLTVYIVKILIFR